MKSNKSNKNETQQEFNPEDLEVLTDYCATAHQLAVIEALVSQNLSISETAKLLDLTDNAVSKIYHKIKKRAAKHGFAPKHDMTHTAPPSFSVKGVSTYYDRDGNVRGQWVKTQKNKEEALEAIQDWLTGLSDEITPYPKIKRIKEEQLNEQLLNLYTITDAHVGMLAWEEEGGDNWNIKIAQKLLIDAYKESIVSAPPAKYCIVNQLGDFFHTDGMAPVTPMSGHVLDADTRFQKMIEVGLDLIDTMIQLALQRHEKVFVVIAEGNHDLSTSVVIRCAFERLYKNNNRVQIINEALPFYAHRHGKVMLAFHHGHKVSNSKLPLLFASEAKYAPMWGQTEYRYAHTGHRHHLDIKEFSGMRVVQHSTLAARDAYASRGGWQSIRETTTYTYHKLYGQVRTATVVPDMFDIPDDL